MTEREQFDASEVRALLYRRQRGYCATCRLPLDPTHYHAAHRIPQRKHWLKRYGKEVIHHPENLRATCPTDACNSAVSLGNNEVLCDELARYIKRLMEDER